MQRLLLIVYIVVLTISTIYLSGYAFELEKYCTNQFDNKFPNSLRLLVILFVPCFLLGWIFKKRSYKGVILIYVVPVVLLFAFIILAPTKLNQFFTKNPIIVDRAIITKKTNSKLSWYAVAKFKSENDSIKRQFKIDGNLLKKKEIGDTILIKYIKDCPNIVTDFDFSPTNDE